MARLNQILAVEKGANARTETAITEAYHTIQQLALFAGMTRTYTPKDDAGETLPGESQKVQAHVPDLITKFTDASIILFDANATKKWANTTAKASVIIDGVTLIPDAPVEYLLFLEKRLGDLLTFLGKLPTLDPAFDWHFDGASDGFATEPVRTNRTKKEPRIITKAVATDKHAAQVDVMTEDITVGYWDTTRLSGAAEASQVNAWIARVAELQAAVKMAREEANNIEVEQIKVGKTLFDWIFETE